MTQDEKAARDRADADAVAADRERVRQQERRNGTALARAIEEHYKAKETR